MNRHILVTGSNGFIGSHLVEKLLENGCKINCMVRVNSDLKWIKSLPVNYIYSDVIEPSTLEKAVKDSDEIYHLGGVVRVVNKKKYYDVNSCGTKNLVEAVKKFNPTLKKFVYVSSQAAYGPDGKGPVSHYGRSKFEGEQWVKELDNWAIAYPAAVYGPRDRDFLPMFKVALKGFFLKPRLAGVGPVKLSFIHISDCVDGIINVGPGKKLFLSDGLSYSWEDVAEILQKVLKRDVKCINIPRSVIKLIGFIGTVTSKITCSPIILNSDKVKEILAGDWVMPPSGLKVECSLEKGFENTYKWYIKMGWL